MNVDKCDWCGTETQNTMDWLGLSRPWPGQDPARGVVTLGRQQLDFCSLKCALAYLEKELDV